ncbi:Hypothetical_protein [Hexamita inflata]|uniref:Hypothetical_protein n=1 Tax=Hexamita inflata TaxID=28002 RepID=A0AA86RTL1_9EUKA|nr:Hypothetical protein HINF_LOCUS65482 [Hexamita inflata]
MFVYFYLSKSIQLIVTSQQRGVRHRFLSLYLYIQFQQNSSPREKCGTDEALRSSIVNHSYDKSMAGYYGTLTCRHFVHPEIYYNDVFQSPERPNVLKGFAYQRSVYTQIFCRRCYIKWPFSVIKAECTIA